mgnify:CR=1 FL=1
MTGADCNAVLRCRIPEFWLGQIMTQALTRVALAAFPLLAGCSQDSQRGGGAAAPSYEWVDLFDGSSLAGWRRLDFGGRGGDVEVRGASIVFGRGDPFTGLVVADPAFAAPAEEYEILVRARKTDGSDFFAAITFPVPEKDSHCTFVAGGWGGTVTGLSNIDHLDANRNRTHASVDYDTDRWYELRIEVRRGLIRCYIDGGIVVNAIIADSVVSMRPGEIEACVPFGLASYDTAAEIGGVRIRALPPE